MAIDVPLLGSIGWFGLSEIERRAGAYRSNRLLRSRVPISDEVGPDWEWSSVAFDRDDPALS
jgi:hypothetical protein